MNNQLMQVGVNPRPFNRYGFQQPYRVYNVRPYGSLRTYNHMSSNLCWCGNGLQEIGAVNDDIVLCCRTLKDGHRLIMREGQLWR